MHDALVALYEERVAPARARYLDAIFEAERTAAGGIVRDLDGLRAVHGDVITFIESRWERWLDAIISRVAARYDNEAALIRQEVFGARRDGGHR